MVFDRPNGEIELGRDLLHPLTLRDQAILRRAAFLPHPAPNVVLS